MAHPQHANTPKLNALLIGKRTVPSGCRVLNVSQQGMSLQCNPDGRLLTIASGDTVDIYLSVQHANGHNKFTIPAIVSNVDENTVDVVFHCTDPELAGLIESYRTSKTHSLEASIDHRLTSRRQSDFKPVAVNESISQHIQPDRLTSQSSRSFYAGLFTLFITSLLLLGAYYYVSSVNNRLDVLETVTRTHTDELAEVQTKVFSSRLQDGRYASLNTRMQALTDDFQSFEKRLTQALQHDPAIIATTPLLLPEPSATSPRSRQSTADEASPPDAEPQKMPTPLPPSAKVAPSRKLPEPAVKDSNTATMQKYPAIDKNTAAAAKTSKTTPVSALSADPVVKPEEAPVSAPAVKTAANTTATPVQRGKPPVGHTGPWIINLISSPSRSYVEEYMHDARSKGIEAVVTSAMVHERQYWRLQIPGFESMAAAKIAAEPVKEQLKIKDVWIHKR